MSEGQKGNKASKKTKKKMSKSHIKYFQDNPDKLAEFIRAGQSNGKFSNTKPELIMKDILTELGLDFIHQWRFTYLSNDFKSFAIADFKLKDHPVVIECDGNYWHNYPYGTENDHIKTQHLQSCGYTVLRFWEHDIHNKAETIKIEIMKAVGEEIKC